MHKCQKTRSQATAEVVLAVGHSAAPVEVAIGSREPRYMDMEAVRLLGAVISMVLDLLPITKNI